jgi:hypothetical protein
LQVLPPTASCPPSSASPPRACKSIHQSSTTYESLFTLSCVVFQTRCGCPHRLTPLRAIPCSHYPTRAVPVPARLWQVPPRYHITFQHLPPSYCAAGANPCQPCAGLVPSPASPCPSHVTICCAHVACRRASVLGTRDLLRSPVSSSLLTSGRPKLATIAAGKIAHDAWGNLSGEQACWLTTRFPTCSQPGRSSAANTLTRSHGFVMRRATSWCMEAQTTH